MSTITTRRIQSYVRITDYGPDRMAAALAYVFGSSSQPTQMAWKIDDDGFHVKRLYVHVGGDYPDGWEADVFMSGPGGIAPRIVSWLKSLSRQERYALHQSTPLDSFRGQSDDGWRMTSAASVPGEALFIPAWV